MAGNKLSGLHLPRGVLIWGSLAVLLALGSLTTLVDFASLSGRETRRANEEGQRAIIDPNTGLVALNTKKDTPAFDVAAEADAPPPAAATHEAAVPAAHEEHAAAPPPTEQPAPPAEMPATPAPAAVSTAPVASPAGLEALRTTPASDALPASTRSAQSLVAAPAREITEMVEGLAIPKRGDKDVTAATLYARPFTRKADQHLLTIVITDVGLSPASLPLIMNLPREVTLAFSPYTRSSAEAIASMRNAGFETWVTLPMMGARYPQDDPGPLGLINTMPSEEVRRRLREVLAATPGAVGVVFPTDEAMSSKYESFLPVMKDIESRGLYMLSTHPTRSLGQIAKEATLQEDMRRSDSILDPTPDSAQIQSKLSGIVDAIKAQDSFILVTSARPQTLELLRDWFSRTTLEEPIMLAPLSAHYKEIAPEAPPAAEEKPAGGHGGGH